MIARAKCSRLVLFAVHSLFAVCATGADFPSEITDPCTVFGFCGPAQLGSSGTISVFSGAASLNSVDTSRAGSLLNPWFLDLGATTDFYLSLQGTGAGGPLRGPSDLNPTGTFHQTGRFFLLELTNTGPAAWQSVRLDVELTPGIPSSDHDALTFGEGSASYGELDLLQFFSSNRFSDVTRIPFTFVEDAILIPGLGFINDRLTDAVVFSDGMVLPNESVSLLFGITSGVGDGTVPDFYLRVAPSAVPEPSTFGLAAVAIAALAFSARRRRTRR
jgi:hypothetical protein